MRERIQKLLASAGVASRRRSEELILQGRVRVNGIVAGLGDRADPRRDTITLDGEPVRPQSKRYIVLNKPAGYITTASDPHGEPTVMELVSTPERLFPVGRLDRDTEGLLLFTNDGDFAHRVLHPRYELQKTYLAVLGAPLDPAAQRQLLGGIILDDGPARTEQLTILDRDRRMVEIAIHEGRNRIVRRMFEAVGNPVVGLTRTAIGPMELDDLPTGKWRDLETPQVVALMGGRSPAFK